MNNDLSLAVQRALTELVAPLRAAAADPRVLQDWLSELGYPASITSDPSLKSIVARVEAVGQAIEGFDAPSLKGWDGLAKLLQAANGLTGIFSDLKQFATSHADPTIVGSLADEIISLSIANAMRRVKPEVFRVISTLGIVEARETAALDPAVIVNGVTARYERALDTFHFDKIGDLLKGPGTALAQRYLPNGLTAATDVVAAEQQLFRVLAWLADELGLAWNIERRLVDAATAATDDPAEVPPDADLSVPEHIPADDNGTESLPTPAPDVTPAYFATTFPTLSVQLASFGNTELRLEIKASSAQHPGALAGFLITPIGAFSMAIPVGSWALTATAKGTLPSVSLTKSGVEVASGSASAGGFANITLKRTPNPASPGPYVVGDPTGTRLELTPPDVQANLYFDTSRRALAISIGAAKSTFVLAPGDSDGFLAKLLPADGFKATVDAGIELSSDKGISMRGNTGLEVTIPAGASIAGAKLASLHLGLGMLSGALSTELSATVAASIGPVSAVVDRVGVTASLTFGQGGNIGIGNLSLGLKKPSGVGLSIDAHGILTGGGFLMHDPAKGLYAGAMQVSLHDNLTLTAFGIISTQLPDGSRGYSMLIFITADGFEPIELGFGFTLTAIGGMIGINRTFDQDAIRAGLKSDTLKTLLFPRDPIANAPAVIQALATAFPAKQGSYLLGILARLSWFTPALANFDLALILEFGARTRLLALGRVSILLPKADNDLIRINLDAMGVLDFDEETVALDAVLIDSRLLHKFAITGGAALRAGWGSGPGSSFLLSVGGFNPHFTPPAGVPALDRVGISLSSGDNPKLHLEAYFAVTSNSVQFGARASLFAKAGGFSISGDLGFDVLITHPPLKYIADFQASVQLKYESHNLFKLDVKGSLAGSKPTRLTGKASFSILWCDFSVPFDHTFDSGSANDALPSVSGTTLLVAAFSDAKNWSVERLPGVAHGVALRAIPVGAAPLLDPLGQLRASQLVVPLNTSRTIDRINGAPLSGDHTFRVSASLNGDGSVKPVQASFAPGHFFTMSDDDKLIAPSFQLMDSGLLFGDAATAFDGGLIVPANLEYDAIVLNPFPKPVVTGGGGGHGTVSVAGGTIAGVATASLAAASVAPAMPAPTTAAPTKAAAASLKTTAMASMLPIGKTPITKEPVDKTPVTKVPIDKVPIDKFPVDPTPTVTLPTNPPPPPPPPADAPLEVRMTYTMSTDSLDAHAHAGAAARVAIRRVGRKRFANAVVPAATTQAPKWAIVPLVGGDPATLSSDVSTWTDYKDALAKMNRAGAAWQMMPLHEVEKK